MPGYMVPTVVYNISKYFYTFWISYNLDFMVELQYKIEVRSLEYKVFVYMKPSGTPSNK